MKRMRRKISSILMTVIMVISMLGSFGVTAEAASLGDGTDEPLGGATLSNAITEINITVDEPLVGSRDLSVKVTVPDDANYTVTADSDWLLANIEEADIIESGNEYGVDFTVTPKEGYALAADVSVTINGSTDGTAWYADPTLPLLHVNYRRFSQVLGTIDTVELTDVPQGNIDDSATPYNVSGEHYSVSGTWSMYDSSTESWAEVDGSHIFARGNIYSFSMYIEPEVGYVFGDEATLILDGVEADDDSFTLYERDGYYNKKVRYATEISEVTIAGDAIPTAVVGQSYDGSKIDIKVPEGSNYYAYGIWHNDDDDEVATVFEEGKAYWLYIYAVPKAGYCMADTVVLNIGEDSYSSEDTAPEYIFHSIKTSFKNQIDKVELNNLPKAVVGETIKKGENGSDAFPIEVPAGANYTAEAIWYLSDDMSIPAEGKFENGKSYDLYISITPNGEYEFADNLIVVIDGVSQTTNGSGDDWADVFKTYSFRQTIDRLEITGVKKPVVGETPSTDTLKVPDGANYKLAWAVWIDEDSDDVATKFEAGHAYRLQLALIPNEGYEFDLYPEIIVDGEDCSDLGYSLITLAYVGCAHTSFEDVIPEVRLNNVPEMKVGEKATVNVTVPENANYEIARAYWSVWNDVNKRYEEFTGIFEAGKTYELSVGVVPKTGYRFDKASTVVYVNDTVDKDTIAYEEGFALRKYYSTNLKEIHRIELTIAEPVVGEHSSIPPQITVPAGANYTANPNRSTWLKNKEYNLYYGYFQEGVRYGADLSVYADEGYKFADDLVVVVNGIVVAQGDLGIDDKVATIIYFFDDECTHAYGDWSDAKDGTHVRSCIACGHKETGEHVYTDASDTSCNVCGFTVKSTDNGTPATGDNFTLELMLMMIALCGAGAMYLSRMKKREN